MFVVFEMTKKLREGATCADYGDATYRHFTYNGRD